MTQLVTGRSLNLVSFRDFWGERCCPNNVAAIHSVVADLITGLSIERRPLHHQAILHFAKINRYVKVLIKCMKFTAPYCKMAVLRNVSWRKKETTVCSHHILPLPNAVINSLQLNAESVLCKVAMSAVNFIILSTIILLTVIFANCMASANWRYELLGSVSDSTNRRSAWAASPHPLVKSCGRVTWLD